MKKILSLVIGATLCGQIAFGQSALKNPASNMWNDAEFVKSFTASYGVLSGFEPEISDPEKDALRALLPIIKSNPQSAIAPLESQIKPTTSAAFNFILANLYFQQGNLNKAANNYRNAVRKYPNFRRAHKNLGLVLVQQGNFKDARVSISKALELGDVDGRAYGLLGYAYLTEGLYYPAEAAYRQAILMQPSVMDWKLGLARCLVETEQYDGAIALFDTLMKIDSNKADFWLLQANAYLGKGDTLAAARNLEVVRRMGAAQLTTLTMLGDIYMNNAMPELALSAYLEALKASGNKSLDALLRASKLFTQTGNFEQGQKLINQVRGSQSGSLTADQDLELLTYEAKIARANDDNEAALALLQKIVERDALNGDALIELGNFYADKNDMARAINRFEQAQLIGEFERKALIAHGQVLVRKGKYQEAVVLLKRAQNLKEESYLADYIQRVERAAR
ncbi:MAG: tetratricopeptide repeat protein [Opitutaceae bacterium]